MHHIEKNLKVSVITFVSARLARPSLEVHLRFTIVPKHFLEDRTIEILQTWKMTKSEFHVQLPHLIIIINNNIILKLKPKRSKQAILFLLDIWNLEWKSPREA